MYLDRVEAGVAHEPGAVFPELHHLCDLFDREGVALDFRVPHPGVFGGGDGQLPVYLVGVASGAAGKLHDGLAAVGVEPFREAARGGNNVVVVPGVAEDALAQLGVEVALTADDHTGTAAGALLIIRNLVFRKGAVPVRHKRTHGRHDDAVFDLHPAYLEWCKQCVVVHFILLLSVPVLRHRLSASRCPWTWTP